MHVCLGNSHHLLELVTHDELHFGNRNPNEKDNKERLNHESLDVKLHEPDARVPVKGPPGLRHPETALATFLNRLDEATISAVKGHNRLAVLRKQGCLHADKRHVGRNDDENNVEEGIDMNQDELGNDHVALRVRKGHEPLRLFNELSELEGAEDIDGGLSRELDSKGAEESGEEQLLEVLALWETLVPPLL